MDILRVSKAEAPTVKCGILIILTFIHSLVDKVDAVLNSGILISLIHNGH